MDQDQKLCDYIFGLLDDQQNKLLEFELKKNKALAKRLAELNETFGGLDSVKDEYPSPLTKMRNRFCQLSYAGLTMASGLTLFWATMFGAVSVEAVEVSEVKDNSSFVSAGISCTSESKTQKFKSISFNTLSHFRK